MLEMIQKWDESVLLWVTDHLRAAWLDPVMVFYTKMGDGGLIFIAAAVIMLLFGYTRRGGISAGISMVIGLLLTNLTIKPLVSRPRPWVVMEGLEVLVKSHDMNSFPSGHTTAAFAFAAAVCSVLPQKWAKAAALIAAALMGFSRLYVGVHFPTDVLAGAVMGTACGVFGGWMAKRVIVCWGNRRDAK